MTCAVLLFGGCDNFAQLPLLGALERPLAGRIKRHIKCLIIIIFADADKRENAAVYGNVSEELGFATAD